MEATKSARTALITGSTKGIGYAIAENMLEHGYHVFINSRSEKNVEEVVLKLQKKYPEATVSSAPGDASTVEGAAAIIREVEAVISELDVLVCNVGMYSTQDFFEIPEDTWLKFFETNVMSTVRLSQHFLKRMLKRNAGRVIVIASDVAFKPLPMMIHQGMTKGALINLSRGMAELTKGSGVTVNAVLPGVTETEGVADYFAGLAEQEKRTKEEVIKEYIAKHEPGSLIQRLCQPTEVASAVGFIASEKSSGVNGSSFRVEGGQIRSI